MPYDPNQPRVPAGNENGGEWTTDGSIAEKAARKAAGLINNPNESINDFENRIRNSQTETGAIFKNGKKIAEINGNENFVDMSSVAGRDLKDAVDVHNHPNNSWFSRGDIRFAVVNDVSQMRVVFSGGTYVMSRRSAGWPSINEFESAIDHAIKKANIQLHGGTIVDIDFIPREAANKLNLNFYYEPIKR